MTKNKLFYFNTGVEVKEGDFIEYKSFFFSKTKNGRVSYIPSKTARELAKVKKQADEWIIELEDKTITGWIYSPEDLQPNKRINFIKRKDDEFKGMTSDELENLENTVSND